MDDASLDDFLDNSEGADPEPDTDAEPIETADTEDAPEDDGDSAPVSDASKEASEDVEPETAASDDGVVPAVTTYQWTPSGALCAACGEQSTRRWQSDEGLVCPDCKEW